jgi:putative acyl-CoA dehydrogenase
MEAVSANGAGGETAALSAFGRQWRTAEMFALGRRANENPPKLYTFNPKGFRRDVVEFHPAYHDLMRASIAAGLHASTWTATGKRASPPAEAARAARYYMAAQVESGHLCRSEALPITPDQIATQAVDAPKAGRGRLASARRTISAPLRRQRCRRRRRNGSPHG